MTLPLKHRVIVLYLAYLGPVTTQSPGKSNPIKGCGYCTIPLGYYSNFGYPNPNIIDNPQLRKNVKLTETKVVYCVSLPLEPQQTPNETSITLKLERELN